MTKLPDLTPEQRERLTTWVEALESGMYHQVTGALRGDHTDSGEVGYCCLGVACDLSGLHEWRLDTSFRIPQPQYGTETGILPPDVAEYYGLDPEGEFPRDEYGCAQYWMDEELGSFDSLVGLNDDAGYDFARIAKVVRIRWLGEDLPE